MPLNVYIPDGEPLVMLDGTLYVYGSYDREADTYCSGEYHVVSTKNLENWTVHDTAFTAKDVYWLERFDLLVYPQKVTEWAHPTPAMRVLIRKMMRHTTS